MMSAIDSNESEVNASAMLLQCGTATQVVIHGLIQVVSKYPMSEID